MGISFIGVFIIVYNIFFWVCGLAQSLAWDYAPGVPQGEEAQRRVPWREKPIGSLVYRYLLGKPAIPAPRKELGDISGIEISDNVEKGEKSPPTPVTASSQPDNEPTVLPAHVFPTSPAAPKLNPRFQLFLRTIYSFFSPINLTIAGSLCIALIQPLKALFVDVSSEGGPLWKGPDGKPPLAFLMDTGLSNQPPRLAVNLPFVFSIAAFIGSITIPLSLVLLGSFFARMKIPRPISRLPIAAILSACVAKMVLLPIIGVFIVRAMVNRGFIPPQNRAQIFVSMYLSGTPISITCESAFRPRSSPRFHLSFR